MDKQAQCRFIGGYTMNVGDLVIDTHLNKIAVIRDLGDLLVFVYFLDDGWTGWYHPTHFERVL